MFLHSFLVDFQFICPSNSGENRLSLRGNCCVQFPLSEFWEPSLTNQAGHDSMPPGSHSCHKPAEAGGVFRKKGIGSETGIMKVPKVI